MGHDDASMEAQAMTDQERTELLRLCELLKTDFNYDRWQSVIEKVVIYAKQRLAHTSARPGITREQVSKALFEGGTTLSQRGADHCAEIVLALLEGKAAS